MEHYVFKHCPCTRPVLDHAGVPARVRGRVQRVRLEKGCPRLAEPGHGSWWYQLELPRGTGRSRCRLRRGGLADEQQARAAIAMVRELLAVPAAGDAGG
ncbi:hypothetical protein [Actinocorallia aurantiaca]|uniref:Uncharacterized protein n=1 Tax=Actinocorallia aurantiaca TaxID=46204 RepID=A0ABN3UC22_9ACTN